MQTLSQSPYSRPDILRWAIFLGLLGPGAALAQGGLAATSGPGGTPVINDGHGVPVIDGLAHQALADDDNCIGRQNCAVSIDSSGDVIGLGARDAKRVDLRYFAGPRRFIDLRGNNLEREARGGELFGAPRRCRRQYERHSTDDSSD